MNIPLTDRIPLATARRIVAHVAKVWGLADIGYQVVGSVRRGCADVGDIDIVAPLPADPAAGAAGDMLYRRIDATLASQGGLFEPAEPPIGTAESGHKPGFKSAVYVLAIADQTAIKLNVSRYTRENRGWTMLRCTGPEQFGTMFLAQWKRRLNIPKERTASIGGHLVDVHGKVVPVEDEQEAFYKCGLKHVEPAQREAVAAHWTRAQNIKGNG